ncbi:hypothetical protein HAD_13199 [Hyphomonas adhaerens MHS-3]|uniref:Uncharacterized protein n=1 Tax=Hyphomonas adhaerens MHS-3 TaxID=1280949 RepID=A0A069E270_9PROT|nr:hypothetical protein [Hyphomonas adhaerens]KCZ83560.1 hypothetical protein HAD_13199 [Hyphomonas adhaerens MHS-3]|tara:strand:+ start:17444 stop:17629 length:186 start_codon:yes stop_codon:yes gene_type:complete
MSEAARIAAQLSAQYGEDAAVIATLRAAEVAAQGDTEALAHWDEVIVILENGDRPDNGPTN